MWEPQVSIRLLQSRKAFVPFKILLIGDSRLSGFHQLIINELHDRHAWDIHVDTLVFPGADIQGTVDNTLDRKLLKEFEAMTGLKQIIDQPTRYARNNTTIDLIFTNSEHISNHGTLNLNISDHEIIYITIERKRKNNLT